MSVLGEAGMSLIIDVSLPQNVLIKLKIWCIVAGLFDLTGVFQ
jgi:hypothetical protein